MSLLDRIRSRGGRGSPAEEPAPFFGAAFRGAPGPEHHLGVVAMPRGPDADIDPAPPPPGPAQTHWPPLDPVPAFSVDIVPGGADRHGADGPLVTDLMHGAG